MRLLLASLLCTALVSAFCPLDKHQICNPGTKHACVCALLQEDEKSAPERSCNRVAEPSEDGEFPAVSITFTLDHEEHNNDTEWPQKEVVASLASTLRIHKDTVIILRANCVPDEDEDKKVEEKFVVQFAVLKKNVNESTPYEKDDFVDAENLATRLKVMLQSMGNVNKLGGMEVEKIEYVEELMDIEYEPNNNELILQAIFMALLFGFMIVLGCVMACRKSGTEDYEDDLQKN